MTPEARDHVGRYRVFVRMWRIVLLLRSQPRTVLQLAQLLSVSEKTIRRDLKALQQIPLPITPKFPEDGHRRGIRTVDPQLWSFGETPLWPRREVAPVADVRVAALPPFPQGPLLPPGVRP